MSEDRQDVGRSGGFRRTDFNAAGSQTALGSRGHGGSCVSSASGDHVLGSPVSDGQEPGSPASALAPSGDADCRRIEEEVYARLTGVMDPELGRSIVDMGMVTRVEAVRRPADSQLSRPVQAPTGRPVFDVGVRIELTIAGCPLTQRLLDGITRAVSSYPDDFLVPRISVGAMSREKLGGLVERLREARRSNPFNPAPGEDGKAHGPKTLILAVASGKGGVGKSAVAANLAAAFAALGHPTAAIDADIYGFSLPGIFGVRTRPTDVGGMLMPVSAWGVKLMSIGMFAGSDQPILWRGPRLQRSLQQFLSDVWWDDPEVMVLDLPPGTGDMAISVAQLLPSAHVLVVTTPQRSASAIAVRAGLATLQLPGRVAGVVENMSWYDHRGERLRLFGEGGGERAARLLTQRVGYDVPLLAQLPLIPALREDSEAGRPSVLDPQGRLAHTPLADAFVSMADRLWEQSRGPAGRTEQGGRVARSR